MKAEPRNHLGLTPWARRAVDGVPGPGEILASADVLLVDDDEADSHLILRALEENDSVATVWARAAPEAALGDLASGALKPNLILLDIQMPKMDGFTFLARLRELPALRHTPVVFLTTSRRSADVENAVSTDVFSYLVKPDSFDELRARVDQLMRKFVTAAA